MASLYILRCNDGALYVGVTHCLDARMARHDDGRGCSFTRQRRPVTLVYTEDFATMRDAMRREKQLKRWTRAKKEALIAGDSERLRRL
jgi:predicted GIY-YIG superfamily endonuclease